LVSLLIPFSVFYHGQLEDKLRPLPLDQPFPRHGDGRRKHKSFLNQSGNLSLLFLGNKDEVSGRDSFPALYADNNKYVL